MSDSDQAPNLERYRIIEKLRGDSLAELYRAEQLDIGRTVLIKALRPGVLPSSPFALTVEREAKLLSELDHPNILRLHDFHRRDDTMYLVLEDVAGPSLEALVRERSRLPPSVAASIALQLCRALGHAHARGVVHRDVQPRNVLVGRDGRVKLTGFAVATDARLPTAPELLDGGTEFGPPSYMSPEQVLGEAPEPRSDLFSLGVVLYECLCGKRPFEAPDSRAVTQRIRHDAPAPLSREVPDLPRPLDAIVQRLLQKLPSDRYFDAQELEAALLDALRGERHTPEELVASFVHGTTPSVAPAGRRATRRREPSLAVGLGLCLLLLTGGAGTIQYAAARRKGAATADGSHLRLTPSHAAYLRVVARPWAHVVVDGERVDTTPFARAIPLAPGRHFVRLEHPNAPTERRTVDLGPDETLLLDVEMKLKVPAQTSRVPPPEPEATDPSTP
jgi:serine/threonine-protein kinase